MSSEALPPRWARVLAGGAGTTGRWRRRRLPDGGGTRGLETSGGGGAAVHVRRGGRGAWHEGDGRRAGRLACVGDVGSQPSVMQETRA